MQELGVLWKLFRREETTKHSTIIDKTSNFTRFSLEFPDIGKMQDFFPNINSLVALSGKRAECTDNILTVSFYPWKLRYNLISSVYMILYYTCKIENQ